MPCPAIPRFVRHRVRALAVLLLGAALPCQVTPTVPVPAPQVPQSGPAVPRIAPPISTPAFPPEPRRQPLDPVWSQERPAQRFQGFPVFPSRLLGGYPGAAGAGPVAVRTLPPAAPEEPGWPKWLRTRGKAPLPYAADLALLIRHTDRVWWRAPDEDAFVPLYFHDKMQSLAVGAEVQVRTTGEFELLLHQSGRLVSLGPADMRLQAMSERGVTVQIRRFTRLRLTASGREHTLQLPDGSTLVVPPDPAEGPRPGHALLMLVREDEPTWHGGRATVFNGGRRAVTWRHAFGETVLEPGHRVLMFLRPPGEALPGALAATGAELVADPRGLDCRSASGGTVTWSGARFQVPAGCSLRLEPLQGNPLEGAAATAAADRPAR